VLGDRARFQPYGIEGGGAASSTEIEMERAGRPYHPLLGAKDEGVEIAAGDSFSCRTPGGGGFGPARARDPACVERDLRMGFMTPAFATRNFHAEAGAGPEADRHADEMESGNG